MIPCGICGFHLEYVGEGKVLKSFMSDGGSHFKNNEVDQFCLEERVKHIVTPAYAPWVNGLIENANHLLLGRLKRLCAPNHDDMDDATAKSTPGTWPDNLDEALRQLNDRILPALNASPRELLFSLPLRPDTPLPSTPLPTSPSDIYINTTLTKNFCANAHLLSLEDAVMSCMSSWPRKRPFSRYSAFLSTKAFIEAAYYCFLYSPSLSLHLHSRSMSRVTHTVTYTERGPIAARLHAT